MTSGTGPNASTPRTVAGVRASTRATETLTRCNPLLPAHHEVRGLTTPTGDTHGQPPRGTKPGSAVGVPVPRSVRPVRKGYLGRLLNVDEALAEGLLRPDQPG